MCNLANCIRRLLRECVCVARVHNRAHTQWMCRKVFATCFTSKWTLENFSIHVCGQKSLAETRTHASTHSFIRSFIQPFIYIWNINSTSTNENKTWSKADMSLKLCHSVRFHFSRWCCVLVERPILLLSFRCGWASSHTGASNFCDYFFFHPIHKDGMLNSIELLEKLSINVISLSLLPTSSPRSIRCLLFLIGCASCT